MLANDLITTTFSIHSCINERTTPLAFCKALCRYLKCLLYILLAMAINIPNNTTIIVSLGSIVKSTAKPAISLVARAIPLGTIETIPLIIMSTSDVKRFKSSPE